MQAQPQPSNRRSCYRCGNPSHLANKCPHRNVTCSTCSKVGHLSRVCLSNKPQQERKLFKPKKVYCKKKSAASHSKPGSAGRVHNLLADSDDFVDLSDVLGHVLCDTDVTEANGNDIIWINTIVAGIPVKMELDTGSKVSLIPVKMYNELFFNVRLEDSNLTMKTYTGENI